MTYIANEQAMKDFGALIGARLRGGEVLELVGDVGAGKTTFVKGLANGLAIDEDIQSPSFTISRTYGARDNLRLDHYDFYRLDDPGIMAVELQESVNDSEAITVIEWADIAADVLPSERLTLNIIPTTEFGRSVELTAHGERATAIVKEIA